MTGISFFWMARRAFWKYYQDLGVGRGGSICIGIYFTFILLYDEERKINNKNVTLPF